MDGFSEGWRPMAGRVYRRCGCRYILTRPPVGCQLSPAEWHRDHGRWYYSMPVTGPNGHRTRVRRGGYDTRAIAEQELAAALEHPEPRSLRQTWTMQRWLEYWLSVVEQRMRPSSGRAYRSIVRRHLIPHLGSLRLADVDGRTVQRFLDLICAQRVRRNGRLIRPGTCTGSGRCCAAP